ncbi:protein LURP-one-related 7-like [Lolium rigidum]|uniref:protein LURP-one-related 7-like n=1 Tax=Lolium rigidum TaxID=89674 RepID=UPI001F5D6F9B|nr:protein LURP-one-related 7-like [Lolium rigidum]XP_047068816.1 protein LURP-one-related 7-like [Lolium rigidum]
MDQTEAAVAAVPPPVPTAAPVVPVDLTVVKKRLGGGGDMAVHDSSGSLAFRVTAADAGGRGRALLDASGSTLVTARSIEGVWQAFRGVSSEQKDAIFSAKVMSASSKRKEVHVLVPPRSSFEDPKPSYILVGNPFQRACTVINGNSIVAQANLPYKLNKPVYSRRKFRVTIYPGNDNILIMAMIMTFLVQK